jgi:hypothetical protein
MKQRMDGLSEKQLVQRAQLGDKKHLRGYTKRINSGFMQFACGLRERRPRLKIVRKKHFYNAFSASRPFEASRLCPLGSIA